MAKLPKHLQQSVHRNILVTFKMEYFLEHECESLNSYLYFFMSKYSNGQNRVLHKYLTTFLANSDSRVHQNLFLLVFFTDMYSLLIIG